MKKKKIAIVLGSNIHWAPYYYKYEQILTKNGYDFDLIIWNRENIEEKTKAAHIFEYNKQDVSNNKNPLKLYKFILFSKFAKKILKKNNYTHLFFLGTHGCAPIFLSNFLKKHYNNKYWLDIRDYQYEWFKPVYNLEKQTIENSYGTAISSRGYEEFLPKFNYYIMHNIDPNINEFLNKFKKNEKSNVIRISFIGNVRYIDENIKLINLFANDKRYILQYFGTGSEKIKDYCERKDIKNIETFGRFKPEETIKFYEQTDIINNVYGNNLIGLTTALSNKLYYSIKFKLPILVSKGTYMEKLTKKYGFSFTIKYDEKYPDILFKEYNEFLNNKSDDKFDLLWKEIMKDEKNVTSKINEFLEK